MAQSTKSLVRERLKVAVKELGRGRPDAARKPLEQAIAVDPGNTEAHAYLGTALLQLGQAEPAIARLEYAAGAAPQAGWIAGNLAEAYFRTGRYEDAELRFSTASRLEPDNLNHRLGLANCMALQQRHDEAAAALEALLRVSPSHPLIWFNLGNVRRDQLRLQDAARCFAMALDAEPGWVDARNNLGSTLHSLFRFAEAEQEYRTCIAADPQRMEFQINLVSVLIDAGRYAEAEEAGRKVVSRWPDSTVGHTFLAAALTQQGKILASLEHDHAAADLDPTDPRRIENYATCLAQVGRFDEAWREFDRAIALQTDPARTHHVRSGALLAAGRLADGWRDYCDRLTPAEFAARYPARMRLAEIPPAPQLRAGAEIDLVSEQGLGDELYFLRFARLLSQSGARVRYRPSDKLRSLLRHAEPVATIVGDHELDPATPIMPIGDLPHALFQAGLVSDTSAPELKYPAALALNAPPERLDAMRRRLLASGPPPYIGVTWSGGVPPRDQKREWTLHKTVDIERLGRALNALPGTLISIQRIPEEADALVLARAAGRTLHDYSDLNDALEDMQALLVLLEEYVGVSNTNMHMRAGAGRAARVLVPAPSEWRWAGQGPGTPWFPDFVCYRQSYAGDWAPALQALELDLRAALSER